MNPLSALVRTVVRAITYPVTIVTEVITVGGTADRIAQDKGDRDD